MFYYTATVVGYAETALQKNGSMVCPQFLNIGTNTAVPLQSIIPTGEDTSDNVQIQALDAYGYTVASYDWNDWANSSACWVDADYAPVEGVSFAPGQAVWVMGSSSNQSLQSSGQVGASDVVVNLQKNGTLLGNPFPVAINLQDIIAQGEDASDNVQIQILDSYGYTVYSYDWNDWANNSACWVDADYAPINGVEISAGQGLWVMGSSTSQSIRFPAPTL